jgi:hypothetical protein
MRGVDSVRASYRDGVFVVRITCRDKEGFELMKRKLRLIGVFVTDESGKARL